MVRSGSAISRSRRSRRRAQEQGAGFGEKALALFEDVGDVFAAEGLRSEGLLDSPGEWIGAMDFAERKDLAKGQWRGFKRRCCSS